jgi:hypothetical protein
MQLKVVFLRKETPKLDGKFNTERLRLPKRLICIVRWLALFILEKSRYRRYS